MNRRFVDLASSGNDAGVSAKPRQSDVFYPRRTARRRVGRHFGLIRRRIAATRRGLSSFQIRAQFGGQSFIARVFTGFGWDFARNGRLFHGLCTLSVSRGLGGMTGNDGLPERFFAVHVSLPGGLRRSISYGSVRPRRAIRSPVHHGRNRCVRGEFIPRALITVVAETWSRSCRSSVVEHSPNLGTGECQRRIPIQHGEVGT